MNKIEQLERERTDLKNKYYKETKELTDKIQQLQYLERKAINDVRREQQAIIRKRNELIKKEYDKGEITQKKLGAKYNLSGARVHDIIGEVERREHAQRIREEGYKTAPEFKKEVVITPEGFRNKLRSYSISFLNLNPRASNCLIEENVSTIGELIQRRERDLLMTPNLGRKTLNEIKYALDVWGLKLGTKINREETGI